MTWRAEGGGSVQGGVRGMAVGGGITAKFEEDAAKGGGLGPVGGMAVGGGITVKSEEEAAKGSGESDREICWVTQLFNRTLERMCASLE